MNEMERVEGESIPASYAEKTMGSLMRLHDELMAEKDRRIGLIEKLSAKEQALAEMTAYVAMLEAELEKGGHEPRWKPAAQRAAPEPRAPQPQPAPQAARPERRPPPPPPARKAEPAVVAEAVNAVDAWAEWTLSQAQKARPVSAPAAARPPPRTVEARPQPRPPPPPAPAAKKDAHRRDDWRGW